jgi:hypothetical protein
MTMTKALLNHVQHIADSLTNPSEPVENEHGDIEGDAFSWLQDALDIEWIVSSDKKTLLGARVLVAFGGPNIWVDTRRMIVEGHWWGDYAEAKFEDNLGIADALNELYNC